MSGKKKSIIEEYKGSDLQSRKLFLKDAEKKAKEGYYPQSENYIPGKTRIGLFILALILCTIWIGFLVFLYMIIVKPLGTLTVTYEWCDVPEEKICPKCAEIIKAAATVCRYCGEEF